LAFKVSEGVDDVFCLEGAIALPDGHLGEDPSGGQAGDCVIGLREAAAYEARRCGDRQDGSTWDAPEQQVGR
jgi:hypothetical protein